MPTFVGLINWTDEGIKNFKESPDRVTRGEQLAERLGASVKEVYWTLGEHDIVAILEAPDDETATAFLLSLGAQGNVRTKTLRAFNRDEMQRIIEKTG
jgi:uncharacterized protein with GYD domain